MLPVAVPKAAPSAGERQAKCFGKPHNQRRAAAVSQSTHGTSPSPDEKAASGDVPSQSGQFLCPPPGSASRYWFGRDVALGKQCDLPALYLIGHTLHRGGDVLKQPLPLLRVE
jgi:hypothetical protein